jgi:threonyl-tRNA synthetase
MLIVGEKEQEQGAVSVRVRHEGDKGTMSMDGFVDHIKEQISEMLK